MLDEPQPTIGPLPQPLPTGTDSYYRQRSADFVRRHPNEQQPSYYLEFGDKALHQFRAVQPDLGTDGNCWLESTLRLLQEAIEARLRRNPAEFEQLELDDDAFHDFAFSTHAPAWIDGGISTLPAADLLQIFRTPDLTDVLTPDGLTTILELLRELKRHDVNQIVEATARDMHRRRSSRVLRWFARGVLKLKSAVA